MLNPLANLTIYFLVLGVLFNVEAPRGFNSR